MPVIPADVAERLITALREGHLPQAPPAGLRDRGLWDGEALEEVLQLLHDRSRAGSLGDAELVMLCRELDRWARSIADDDHESTVELPTPTVPVPAPSTADPVPRPVQLRRGTVLRDRYVLEDPVGSGGLSTVFHARDLRREPGEPDGAHGIAVKVLRPEWHASAAANARLKREFRQTRALRHRGTVQMFDLDLDGDAWFITMELLTGTSLDARLQARPVDRAEALRVVSECAEVLAFAHERGILHGDIKPGNVFVAEDGSVKVLDFGALPEAGDPGRGRDEIPRAATRAYASPEILAQEAAEPRDDVFSLACVAYELLSGRHPFRRLPALEARDLMLAPAVLPQLSAAQNAALASALAWRRSDRPATVREFIRQLDGAAQADAAPPARTGATVERRLWPWLGVSVATATVLFAFWRAEFPERRDDAVAGLDSAAAGANVPQGAHGPGTTDGPADESPPSAAGTAAASVPSADTVVEAAGPVEPDPPALATSQPPSPPPASAATRARARVSADRSSIVVTEGTHAAVVVLHRDSNLATAVQVTWRLSDGTARLQDDFSGPSAGTTRFLPGQATRAIYVPLIDDTVAEADESFSLALSSRSAAIGPTGDVTITILDDDG